MKNDGTSNPCMRWSAIVYIAYWSILILRMAVEQIDHLSGSWSRACPGDFMFISAVAVFVFLGMPLLATLIYAQALFTGKSAFGFAAWILSMMIFPFSVGSFYYDPFIRSGWAAFFMIFGALLILPVVLSAFSAKIRYTIPMTLSLYILYFTGWFFMVATIDV